MTYTYANVLLKTKGVSDGCRRKGNKFTEFTNIQYVNVFIRKLSYLFFILVRKKLHGVIILNYCNKFVCCNNNM